MLHKKAYASYKAFEFLKGREQAQSVEKLSPAKQRLRDNDPYNFPELDATLAEVLSSKVVTPTFRDGGDAITTPGRRLNGYSEQEVLEAYFGKDFARKAPTNIDGDDSIFSTQKSLKERYPRSSFAKMPLIQEQQKTIDALGFQFDYSTGTYPVEIKNKEAQAVIEERASHGLTNMYGPEEEDDVNELNDKMHPKAGTTEQFESRSYNSDLTKMTDKLMKIRKEQGLGDTMDWRQYRAITRKLKKEYKMDKVKKKRDWFE